MKAGFPGWRSLAVPAGAGLVLAFGQAPLGLWWLALPALAVLVHQVTQAQRRGAAAWVAWAGGAAYFAVTLSWIISPFLVEPETHGWMAPFALVLMAGGLALFWAVAGAAAHLARQVAPAFAVALAGMELARGYVFTGFPWGLIGHMWIDTPMAQLAAIIGPNGLNLITLLVVALPVAPARRRGAVAAGVIAIAALALSLHHGGSASGLARDVSLRLVQPNAAQDLKWDPDMARTNFARLLDLTEVQPVADLTIWPETAVPYLIDTAPEVGQMIAAASGGRPVIVGYQRVDGAQGWNSLGLIGPAGGIAQYYDKAHLVPFGEYMPFGDIAYDWFGLRAFASQLGRGYVPGVGPQVMDLGPDLGMILPLICYEAVFPQDVNAAPARADWILQITNDAWFGTLTGPWQHAAQARFRAIEQGLPLVRVANTGVTAVYDAHGQVVAELQFGVADALNVAQVPGALPPTPYSRYGEAPFLLLLAGLGLGLVLFRKPKAA